MAVLSVSIEIIRDMQVFIMCGSYSNNRTDLDSSYFYLRIPFVPAEGRAHRFLVQTGSSMIEPFQMDSSLLNEPILQAASFKSFQVIS